VREEGRPGEPGTRRGSSKESLTGRLLVATPALRDPNFERTVVFVVAHEDGGAMGVVLNRATEVAVTDVLAAWGGLAGEPSVIFEGGPVTPEAAICLVRVRPEAERLDGFSRIAGQVGTVDLASDPGPIQEGLIGVRVFAGYAGWLPGQLENEISDGSWFVFDALPGDAFAPRPDDLWSMVLRRQGGILAAVAHFPADPTFN